MSPLLRPLPFYFVLLWNHKEVIIMLGAILGDIIGSPYEFDRGNKSKEFELFHPSCEYTDDTVMTIAIADALLRAGNSASNEYIRSCVIFSMRSWGKKYPNAGYGSSFIRWVLSDTEPKPYGSYGNGSAMRVSSAGWLYKTLDKTRRVARITAEVTHNHPEGIKGAEAVASAIYLARTGKTKEEIKNYIVTEFGYDLSRTCDEIRPNYYHVESCQQTVPEAITAFLEGESFEDVIRTAVSLGGDCDTLTCIAASIAEAYYGIEDDFMHEVFGYLPSDMKEVLERFLSTKNKTTFKAERTWGNEQIKRSLHQHIFSRSKMSIIHFIHVMKKRIESNGSIIVPVEFTPKFFDEINPETVKVGDTITLEDDLHIKFRTLQDEDRVLFAAFTDSSELHKGNPSDSVIIDLEAFLDAVLKSEGIFGAVINPWSENIILTKELIHVILNERV